ncbi:MAG: ATP-dependent zinc metalloprotease FtsH [Candidatus Aminicenantes bacterium]
MNENKKKSSQQGQFKDSPSHRPPFKSSLGLGILIWIVILTALGYFFFHAFRTAPRINIPYSTFKHQVQEGNVSEINIKGQEITGEFKEDYQPPGEDDAQYQQFSTTRPDFEDPALMNLLEEQNVTVRAETTDGNWWTIMLILLLPWILIFGYFAYMRNKAKSQMNNMGPGRLFGMGKSRAKRYTKTKSDMSYDDVAGLENAKKDLREIIDYLREPKKFQSLGADIPKGVLLVGPPGTGKTLLAKATAGEADVPFFSISGSEFIEMFVGVGASRVRDMFQTAKKSSPSIIFVDELDSIGRARGTGVGGGHDEREQTLNQILNEMDGFKPHQSVIVLAATNRPDVLDPALIRPGRFDRQIPLDMPQKAARKKILEIHTRNVPLDKDMDLDNLAARTVGFSGADLENLVNEAALLAARENKEKVGMDNFVQARDKIILGHKREDMISDEEKQIIAYHEAGHALLAKTTPGMDPLEKVTIIPRGRSLGATEMVPEEDRHNFRKDYLLKRIRIMLGGRASEKLIFNDISNGAADDLKQATKLSRQMITQWGMSDRLGPVTFSLGEEHLFLGREMAKPKDFSENTARIIDEEIQKTVSGQEKKALEGLKKNRSRLKKLAEALIEKETLEREEIDKILEDNQQSDSSS